MSLVQPICVEFDQIDLGLEICIPVSHKKYAFEFAQLLLCG